MIFEPAVPEGLRPPRSTRGGSPLSCGHPALPWAGRHPYGVFLQPGTPLVPWSAPPTLQLLLLLVESRASAGRTRWAAGTQQDISTHFQTPRAAGPEGNAGSQASDLFMKHPVCLVTRAPWSARRKWLRSLLAFASSSPSPGTNGECWCAVRVIPHGWWH